MEVTPLANPEPARTRRTVHVVLPTYNEERRLGRLLERIDEAMFETGQPYRVTLVDDGSTDGTHAIAEAYAQALPIEILQHGANRGLGATLRDGLYAAVASADDRDVIVTMDADDTHSPGLIMRMARMTAEGHDVVIASRYQPGARVRGVPVYRQALSLGASWLFRALLPIPGVRDFTCGFRAYRAGVVREAIDAYGDTFVDQEGFQCMVDVLLKLRRFDLVFGEVPLVLRYDFKEGGSKMDVGSTVRQTLRLLFRHRFGL